MNKEEVWTESEMKNEIKSEGCNDAKEKKKGFNFVDYCGICINLMMDRCVKCTVADRKFGECTVAWGRCSHAFHFHCIASWLRDRKVCPLDNTQWEFQNYGQ